MGGVRDEGEGSTGGADDEGDRVIQEDAWLVAQRPAATLCAVCDAMGGMASGRHAADFVLEGLRVAFAGGADARGLLGALEASNRVILARSEAARARAPGSEHFWLGSGTTAEVVLFEGGRAHVAHVGDGRIYRQREGRLVRLTTEHTLQNEFLRSRRRLSEAELENIPKNVIVRALGMTADVAVDRFDVGASRGDRFLLCSNGLTDLLDDAAIAATLDRHPDGADAARALVEAALAAPHAGGRDNLAVVVHDVRGAPGPGGEG
ncbi:MAG TPA: protein phosphatase 2C domain-containing protein [Polyangiaceae bacterium]|nr:protein phosphatase 2C domain-containing protein [Polyangiaceae bacterium]